MNWRLSAALAAFVVVSAVPAGVADAGSVSQARFDGMQLAGLFGESDEEKAARLQHEADQDAAIAELRQRVHDLEQSLQVVTGQNEQLAGRIRDLAARIDQQQKNFDTKLCSLAAAARRAYNTRSISHRLSLRYAGGHGDPGCAGWGGAGFRSRTSLRRSGCRRSGAIDARAI